MRLALSIWCRVRVTGEGQRHSLGKISAMVIYGGRCLGEANARGWGRNVRHLGCSSISNGTEPG